MLRQTLKGFLSAIEPISHYVIPTTITPMLWRPFTSMTAHTSPTTHHLPLASYHPHALTSFQTPSSSLSLTQPQLNSAEGLRRIFLQDPNYNSQFQTEIATFTQNQMPVSLMTRSEDNEMAIYSFHSLLNKSTTSSHPVFPHWIIAHDLAATRRPDIEFLQNKLDLSAEASYLLKLKLKDGDTPALKVKTPSSSFFLIQDDSINFEGMAKTAQTNPNYALDPRVLNDAPEEKKAEIASTKSLGIFSKRAPITEAKNESKEESKLQLDSMNPSHRRHHFN